MIGFTAAAVLLTASAMQMSPSKSRPASGKDLELIMLDESEVESRGSHCLDGSTPGYLYKQGTVDDKWIFWFQGSAWCKSEQECADEMKNIKLAGQDDLPLMKSGEFSEYHHVMFERCDVGLYMGDLAEPVVHNGVKLYFQGKRIIDHVLATLQSNSTFGSATEVLMAGGSGGGQSAYIISDYFAGVMPASVKKFGVAPINGWYANGEADEMKYMFDLANMKTAISPKCAAAFSAEDAYKCLDSAVSYEYSTSPTFLIQSFDYTFAWSNSDPSLKTAWTNCLHEPTGACDADGVDLLQEHLTNFTGKLQSIPKYNEAGQGGFLTTCTEHEFYDDDDLFSQYSNNGVSVGDAVSSWWKSLGTSASPTWHLPCSLGSSSNAQCESSC